MTHGPWRYHRRAGKQYAGRYLRPVTPTVPAARLRERLLLAIYRRNWDSVRSETGPRLDAALQELVDLGLVVRGRARSLRWRPNGHVTVTGRNYTELTRLGEEVIWAGQLPQVRPTPRSLRKEKRSRHV